MELELGKEVSNLPFWCLSPTALEWALCIERPCAEVKAFGEGTGHTQCYFSVRCPSASEHSGKEPFPHFCINTLAIRTSGTPRNTELFFSYTRAVSAKPPGSTIPASAIRIGVTEIVPPWVVLGITFMVLLDLRAALFRRSVGYSLAKLLALPFWAPQAVLIHRNQEGGWSRGHDRFMLQRK